MMSIPERIARALCRLDGHPENTTMDGNPLWQDYLPEATAAIEAMPSAMVITDWFERNSDPRNPEAFINTNPQYFAEECAAAIQIALKQTA